MMTEYRIHVRQINCPHPARHPGLRGRRVGPVNDRQNPSRRHSRAAGRAPKKQPGLKPMTTGAQPISAAERATRLAKLQDLMHQQKVAALLVEAGTTLDYFTGVNWHLSERVTAAVIPASGKIVIVTPFFERPTIEEMLQVPAEVRPWQESESPFALIAAILNDGSLPAGALAVDVNTRFFVFDTVTQALKTQRTVVSGTQLVRACRMFKSPAELALMSVANDVTLAALRYVHAHLEVGMRTADVAALMEQTTVALGATPEFSLALLNEASAFPHGSKVSQAIRNGSVVLMDCGCIVHGYQSDISRTWVFGEPTARQRKVWDTVKRGQEIALETAKIGTPVGEIDTAVRRYYESARLGQELCAPGIAAQNGPRHWPRRSRVSLPGPQRQDRITARNVLLRRARHLHPRRVRRPPGGLLAHDGGGPETLHPASQIPRRSDLRKRAHPCL